MKHAYINLTNASYKNFLEFSKYQIYPFRINSSLKTKATWGLKEDIFVSSKQDYLSFYNRSKKALPKFGKENPVINLEINGKSYTGEYIADGIIKKVYRINENGQRNVICLPSDYAIRTNSWDEIFDEQENTKKIKDLGLLTNDLCKVELIKLNGKLFPALKMKHYEEHDFKIFDPKNTSKKSPALDSVIDLEKISTTDLEKVLAGIGNDINTLVKNDISLFKDSFCFAKTQDNKLRLYFHDLGNTPAENNIFGQNKMDAKQKITNAKKTILNVTECFLNTFKLYDDNKKDEIVKILQSYINK